jgi:hypothetical protein
MTVADWKGALLTLNDGHFFDLMRSYLGDIRTPFNKQRLVDDLEGFLGRRDIQEAVASYLDEVDRRVIAAVGVLGDPAVEELAGFFEGEYSYAELHAILLNLEERLILFRLVEGGVRRLARNPVLAPVLDPIAVDRSRLFPSEPLPSSVDAGSAAPSREAAALDDLFLAAVAAYVRGAPNLFRSDGTYRKKALEDIAAVFTIDRFTAAADALRAMGILEKDEGGLNVDEGRLESFGALPEADRAAYVAAGLIGAALEEVHRTRSGRAPRDLLAAWARLTRRFVESLDAARRYPETTLFRLLDAAERAVTLPRRRRWESRAADPAAELRAGAERGPFRAAVLAAAVGAGLLRPEGDGFYSRKVPGDPKGARGAASPAVSLDSAFSVIVQPGLAFSDAVRLTTFLEPREAGAVVRFELTRDAAVRSFNRGLEPAAMVALLERLTGRPVPQNIRWSAGEWHARYAAAAVYRGVVLALAEDRRFIMQTPAMSALVSRVVAPGVYLLNVASEADAAAALGRAGMDIVAVPTAAASGNAAGDASYNASGDASGDDPRFAAFPPLEKARQTAAVETSVVGATSAAAAAQSNGAAIRGATASDAAANAGEAAARLRRLRSALEAKRLPKDQQDELSARVERRVILTESQLVGAAVRFEKLEAKGLDYVGKVRVAEQALSTGSLIELFWRGPKGEPNRALGAPAALDKAGGEVELVVDPVPRGERVRIAVGKISVIRRIKRSIFGE